MCVYICAYAHVLWRFTLNETMPRVIVYSSGRTVYFCLSSCNNAGKQYSRGNITEEKCIKTKKKLLNDTNKRMNK